MSNKENPIAKDLRTPKYRKRVVKSRKKEPKREFMELERQIDAEYQQDNKRLKWE
jgi:hypothetical protein